MTESERDPDAEHFAAARDLAREAAAPPPGLPTLSELQARFPEFELRGLIGRGGMGAVYRAHDPKLDRSVAIKILPAQLGDDPSFAERFAQEARTLARLRHPHILTLHDYGERDGLPYLVTEFVEGVDLRRLMAGERVDPAETLRIVPQICAALQFAHDQGVVHRDIKPENVLVDTDGHVKVADFGIARIVGGDGAALGLTATRDAIGTPHYTAPETLRGGPVDHRADLFALGVVLYELLTGRLPLGRFTPPSRLAGTDPRLDGVVARTLRDEPEQRYPSAAAVRVDLAQATPRRRRSRPRREARSAARSERNVFSVILVVTLVAAVVLDNLSALASFSPLDALGLLAAGTVLAAGAFASHRGFRLIDGIERGDRSSSAAVAVLLAWLPPLFVASAALVFIAPWPWQPFVLGTALLGAVAHLIRRVAALRRSSAQSKRRIDARSSRPPPDTDP